MATTISSGTNPYKLGSPPDFGTLYSGRALDFDGVTDYVNIGRPVLGSSFTYAVWISPDNVSSSGHIIGDYYGSGNETYLRQSSQALAFQLYISSETLITSPNVLKAGSWHHVVAVYDSGATHKIYVDGVEVVSGTAPTGSISQSGDSVIGARYAGTGDYLDGKITNVQIWDKAWSLSDVQYAYTHPEKLITHNSAVTSGTTISNLKAWYPCTEGNPRSPQTTVYDGSPKELGTEELGTADNDWNVTSSNWSISSGVLTFDGIGTANVIHTGTTIGAFTFSTGAVYKLQLTIANSSDDARFQIRDSDGVTIVADTTYANGLHTFYFSLAVGGFSFRIDAIGAGSSFDITSYSLKEVQMGNHGTTTFYGEELVTYPSFDTVTEHASNNNSWIDDTLDGSQEAELTQNTSAGNAKTGSNSGAVAMEATTCYLSYRKTDLTAGRTYSSEIYIKSGSGSGTGRMVIGTASRGEQVTPSSAPAVDFNTSGWSKIYATWVASQAEQFITIIFTNVANAETHYIDDFSLKEVGVATGWTTADAEPLIPQTALMGMSKPMVFDGVDDYLKIDSAIGNLGSTASISAWISRESVTSSASYLFDARGDGAGGTGYCTFGAGASTFEGSDGTEYVDGALGATVPADGKFHHVVLTGATVNISEDIRFGARYNNISLFYGVMNEISLWNKTLTLAEVQELFNDGVPLDATTHSASPSTGTDNLIGYWRNDGAVSWADRSQNSNNGTPTNATDTILLPEGTTAGKDILGFPLTHTNNGWLNLSGTETTAGNYGYVKIPDNDTLDGYDAMTWSFWLKPDGLVGNNFVADKRVTNQESWRIIINDSSGDLNLTVSGDGTNEESQLTTDLTLPLNTWTFVTMIFDSGTFTVYKNDNSAIAIDAHFTSQKTIFNSTTPVYIGSNAGGARHWDGAIDEFRIYNRAISAPENLKNYKHGKSKHS